MSVEDAGDLPGLGLAQDGELPGCVDHGAVVLTELNGDVSEGIDLGRVARSGERFGNIDDRCRTVPGDRLSKALSPPLSEPRDGLLPELLGHVSEGRERQVVVGRVAGGAAAIGEGVDAAGAASSPLATRAIGGPLMSRDKIRLREGGEGATDPRRRQAEVLGQLRGCRGTKTQKRTRYTLGGLAGEFHNIIVP